MNNLFDNDSESENENKITTNKEFAKSYAKQKQIEMIHKFKDHHFSDLESDASGSSSSEDDDEPVNPEFTKTFLKTLSSLKSDDPKIYDKNVNFFRNISIEKPQTEKKSKLLNLENYERKMLLKTSGKIEDSEEEDGEARRTMSPTIVEEERQLKDELKKVLADSDSEGDEEFGSLFKKRNKSKQELEKEEAQYTKWLAGQPVDIGQDVKSLNPLKEFWSNPSLSKDEKFLRDYILNQGYADDDDEDLNNLPDPVKLSEDEEEVEKMEDFEHRYNFRYEEPDQAFIKRYPRTIQQSVRKTDDKRKEKRLEVKERKLRDKEHKLQELQVLKAAKRQEIEEKIQKLKEVTGNDELAFEDAELEKDFDPDEYDYKMQKMFNDEYYQMDEGDEKPECPDFEELKIENYDNWDPSQENDNDHEPHCEDDEFNMNADYDVPIVVDKQNSLEEELIENSRGRRKRRRQSKFVEVLKKEKPVFDPEDEINYGEYIDEYYKMDYEDMIGDIPCRFKYVETVPNDFGLTVEEILMAKNSELNNWVSLKKAVQIRPDHIERNEVNLYKKRASNLDLKKKILKSLYEEPEGDEDEEIRISEATIPSTNALKKKKKKIRNRKLDTVKGDNVLLLDNQKESIESTRQSNEINISRPKSKKAKEQDMLSIETKTSETFSIKVKAKKHLTGNNDEEIIVKKKRKVSIVSEHSICEEPDQDATPLKKQETATVAASNEKPRIRIHKKKARKAAERERLKEKYSGAMKTHETPKSIKLANSKVTNVVPKTPPAISDVVIKPSDPSKPFHKKKARRAAERERLELLVNKKPKRNNFKKHPNKSKKNISNSRLWAFGINPSKYHYMEKQKQTGASPANHLKKATSSKGRDNPSKPYEKAKLKLNT